MLKVNFAIASTPPMPQVGDTVDHFLFFQGVVLKVEGGAVTVNFQSGGVKWQLELFRSLCILFYRHRVMPTALHFSPIKT